MYKHTKLKSDEWQGQEAHKRIVNRRNYPGAPCAAPGILKKYEELIDKSLKGIKDPWVLILGSTPETREMILKRGYNLVTIDIGKEMIELANKFITTNQEKEEVIVADWLEMPLFDNYFDLIIGDGVFNNVLFADCDKFAQNIIRVSKKDAKVIFREAVINPQRAVKSIRELIRNYRKSKNHWFDLFFDLLFYCDEKHCWYQADKMENRLEEMYKQIDNYFKEGIINKTELNDLNNLRSKIIHTFLTRPVFERFLKKYFKLLPVKQVKDHRFTRDTMIFFYGKVKK